MKQIIPDWRCKEVGYLGLISALVIVRTMMSIWLADVNGRIVKAIVNKDLRMFIYRVRNHTVADPLSVDFHFVFVRRALQRRQFGH